MWLIPKLEDTFVSVDFSSQALVCCWIERIKGTSSLELRAYKRFPLDSFELEKLILFNPTRIQEYIVSFLKEHALSNAFVAFIFCGSMITEQFIAMPTSTPHYTDFEAVHKNRNVLCEYRYIYSNDHGQFVFYVYTVPRFIILQYQLLAIAACCNVTIMTTRTMMLLSAYKAIFGPVFRRSQLAVDMMRCNNKIEDLLTIDTLNRLGNFKGNCNASERLYYAAGIGLFCSERINV